MSPATSTVESSSIALDIFLRMRAVHTRERSAIAMLNSGTPEERRLRREEIERLRDEWITLCGEYCSAMAADSDVQATDKSDFPDNRSPHLRPNENRFTVLTH